MHWFVAHLAVKVFLIRTRTRPFNGKTRKGKPQSTPRDSNCPAPETRNNGYFRAPLFQAEAAVEMLDDPVALASGFFEAFAIQDPYGAARIFDQSGILEGSRRHAHAGP